MKGDGRMDVTRVQRTAHHGKDVPSANPCLLDLAPGFKLARRQILAGRFQRNSIKACKSPNPSKP